jgi:protein O-GlcNAc transferase
LWGLAYAMDSGRSPPSIDHGMALHRQVRLAEAEAVYRAVLARDPKRFEVHYLLAHLRYQQGDSSDALSLLASALALNPRSFEAWSLQSAVLFALNRHEEALAACDRALTLNAGDAEAYHNRALILVTLEKKQEALSAFDRALAIKPDFVSAHFNRANLLAEFSRYEDALSGYQKLLSIAPFHLDALNNHANVLAMLGRTARALTAFERVLAANPNHLNALNNRGIMLKELLRLTDALASFDQALAVNPEYADALYNRGNTLVVLNRLEEACDNLERALAINPKHVRALNALSNARAAMCDWTRFGNLVPSLIAAAQDGEVEPFTLLGLDLDPADVLDWTRKFLLRKLSRVPESLSPPAQAHSGRIKVAYLSSDFREHPISNLTARLFELHDRSRFEVIAISFGVNDNSNVRARLVSAFDQFHDVRDTSDRDIAQLISDLAIDIAVDLNGLTQGARLNVLSRRPAPIQINYLGYPGTTGAEFIDYVIADRLTIPPDQQRFYSEHVVYLPDTYQANDDRREISEATPTREEAGLPQNGFVFCSFNNSFKITPGVFDVWMNLLRQVDGSALWLLEGNARAPANLRAAAERRGVAGNRLVFAQRLELKEHLARLRLADLFLDTLPYNAHTTASDALWAGVPVLTCLGRSFPGRVAGSLLQAVGLPELITSSLGDYETRATTIASDPDLLVSLKQKLARNIGSTPLFDSPRFTRHIESAYRTMWETWKRGESPHGFSVQSNP